MALGIIGTSWWVDSMYLPSLTGVAQAKAISGRDPDKAQQRAEQWNIPSVYTDWEEMLAQETLDGVIIAAANPVHYPAAKLALEKGLAVVCEKPLAQNYQQAAELANLARDREVTTLVPFTYAYMPAFLYLEQLVTSGWIGEIYHLNLRYHTGYGLDGKYRWKLDQRHNPSGALGDIGVHFIYLGLRLTGDWEWVQADLTRISPAPPHPAQEPYQPASDSARLVFGFGSDKHGTLESTVMSWAGTPMGQRHWIEVWGSKGMVSLYCDWDRTQEVWGAQVGKGPVRALPIPEEIWGDLRRDTVHNTYRDVFRTTDAMTRGWVKAAERGERYSPGFAEGAAVQAVVDASMLSSEQQRRVSLTEITDR